MSMSVATSQGETRTLVITKTAPIRIVDQKTNAVDILTPGVQGPPGPKGDPGTGAVSSVNGMAGDVVLGAADVHADPEGAAVAAASAAVSAHLADPDPHIQYRKKTDILDGGNF